MEYNPDFPYFEPPYCVSVFMENTGAGVQGDQGDQRAPSNPDVDQSASLAARGPTGAEALSQPVAAFEEELQTQVTPENQEEWRTRVEQLRHQVINIHKEINAEAPGLAEKENQLAQQATRLRQES